MASGQRNLKGRLSWSCAYRLGTLALTTFYSYDDMGRIEWIVQKGISSASKKIAYFYDQQGNTKKKAFTDVYNSQNNYYWGYEYDQVGRLARAYSGSDSASRAERVRIHLSCDWKGEPANSWRDPSQTVSYTYSQRDWVKTITAAQFWEQLGYDIVAGVGSTSRAVARTTGTSAGWHTVKMGTTSRGDHPCQPPFSGTDSGTTRLIG